MLYFQKKNHKFGNLGIYVNRKVWFDFHIRYRGENIAKGLAPFSKNSRSMQSLKHLCYKIRNSTFNDK